jgi:hypothetical protein
VTVQEGDEKLELVIKKQTVTFESKKPKAVYLEVKSINSEPKKVREKMRLRCVMLATVEGTDMNFVFWMHLNS